MQNAPNASIAGQVGSSGRTTVQLEALDDPVAPSTAAEWTRARVHLRPLVRTTVILDAICALIAGSVGTLVRFGEPLPQQSSPWLPAIAACMPGLWIITMALSGSYDRRFLVIGQDQFRRVLNGGVWLLGIIAFTSFVTRANLSRGFVAIAVPLTVTLALVGRYGVRKRLHRRLARGAAIHRALVVGDTRETESLVRHMERNRHIGFSAVAFARPGGEQLLVEHRSGLTSHDFKRSNIYEAARWVGANTIVVAGMHVFRQGELKRLAWGLEGKGVELVVAPALTDFAGPRLVTRPVDGLPLMYLEEPRFRGSTRIVKEVFDRAMAGLLILVLSPILVVAAGAILVTTGRPVFFRQLRPGQAGRVFEMLKFRTMREGREPAGEGQGMVDPDKGEIDPRVTRVGRFLRRHSIDELPQLWNVVRGDMALVGPRPLLSMDAVQQEGVRRRLLMKPGMTGLWQVSGRSDLSWDERMRLDLYYTENWSVTFDLVLIVKTVGAVVHGRGAY